MKKKIQLQTFGVILILVVVVPYLAYSTISNYRSSTGTCETYEERSKDLRLPWNNKTGIPTCEQYVARAQLNGGLLLLSLIGVAVLMFVDLNAINDPLGIRK